MDRHWITLEYPAILEKLAGYVDFSGGRTLVEALEPQFDIRIATEQLALTTEARGLLISRPDFGLGGVTDIRIWVDHAQHGMTLQPEEFLQVRSTLMGAARIHRVMTRLETQFPKLADIAWRIRPAPNLVESIARVLDDRGEIRDNASPELARVRRELRVTQGRIQERLQRMIGSSEVGPYLQEALITRRDGRFVIPVQSDFKGQVRGIVHDRSSSGATLFMEPTQVVELNNNLRELHLAERDEIIRLMRALTAELAAQADEIIWSLDALSELDLHFAKARYAEEILATEPELVLISDDLIPPDADNQYAGTVLRLRGARHPLIPADGVVPIDIDLDEGTHVLVITGPNTGGKTVSLKTTGLLTLMALAGMHIPVDKGSQLSCFDRVVADIGDEQSIEQSLSTFSSHLTNILSFLDDVDHHTLVLMDELGAGTDPAEGSALAWSLLEAFRNRRCVTFVATHYPELKLYAHSTPGVRNASMEFSLETLAPTYKLIIGLAGRSNAFAIASRLGMPKRIIKQAQKMVSGEDRQTEAMLTDLHHLRLEAVESRSATRLAQMDAERIQKQLNQRLADIEHERQDILQRAEVQALDDLEAVRAELADLKRKMLAFPMREAPLNIEEVEDGLNDLDMDFDAPEPRLEGLKALEKEQQLASDPNIRAGDTVKLTRLGMQGTVVDLDDGIAILQAGALRTRVPLDDLELVHHGTPPREAQPVVYTPPSAASPGIQLDLRGLIVDEALERLEKHLDAAAMVTLPWIRVVHGKGTGKLRNAVQRCLHNHPLVVDYEVAPRNEGGEGATIVHLVVPDDN